MFVRGGVDKPAKARTGSIKNHLRTTRNGSNFTLQVSHAKLSQIQHLRRGTRIKPVLFGGREQGLDMLQRQLPRNAFTPCRAAAVMHPNTGRTNKISMRIFHFDVVNIGVVVVTETFNSVIITIRSFAWHIAADFFVGQ